MSRKILADVNLLKKYRMDAAGDSAQQSPLPANDASMNSPNRYAAARMVGQR